MFYYLTLYHYSSIILFLLHLLVDIACLIKNHLSNANGNYTPTHFYSTCYMLTFTFYTQLHIFTIPFSSLIHLPYTYLARLHLHYDIITYTTPSTSLHTIFHSLLPKPIHLLYPIYHSTHYYDHIALKLHTSFTN